MSIGENIRAIRKARGLTQIEVAQKAGFSVNSLRLYEAGKRDPNFSQINKLCEALDATVLDLVPDLPKKDEEIWKTSWELGYADREEEFREEVDFACHELQRRKDDPQYLRMLLSYESLSNEGQQRVVEYAEALAATGNYTPAEPTEPIALYGKDGFVTKTKKPLQGNQKPHDGK